MIVMLMLAAEGGKGTPRRLGWPERDEDEEEEDDDDDVVGVGGAGLSNEWEENPEAEEGA